MVFFCWYAILPNMYLLVWSYHIIFRPKKRTKFFKGFWEGYGVSTVRPKKRTIIFVVGIWVRLLLFCDPGRWRKRWENAFMQTVVDQPRRRTSAIHTPCQASVKPFCTGGRSCKLARETTSFLQAEWGYRFLWSIMKGTRQYHVVLPWYHW